MTSQDRKEYLDLLSKKSDIINKKAILLLAVSGGVGAYAMKFLFESNNYTLGYLFGVVCIIGAIGVFINYNKLNKIEKQIGELEYV